MAVDRQWLIDGEAGDCVPADDRGLQYADGLFETIRVANGNACHWAAHMQRLSRGCTALGLSAPLPELWLADFHRLFEESEDGVLKLIVTAGDGGRGYYRGCRTVARRLAAKFPLPAPLAGWPGRGVRLRYCRTPWASSPATAGLKHLGRIEQVLARSEWSDAAIAEGLMADPCGHIISGTMSNLFIVMDGTLLTPALTQCGVAGVMRSVILEQASSCGIPVHTVHISRSMCEDADEMFLCNAVRGILPVAGLEKSRWQAPGPLTSRLLALLTSNGAQSWTGNPQPHRS